MPYDLSPLFKNPLKSLLYLLCLLLGLYIFIPALRCYLTAAGIDPNFIVGFLTAIALLVTLIQNNKDKKYAYNLRLGESMEEKGVRIIGKLLTVKHAAYVFSASLPGYKQAIDEGVLFKNLNTVDYDGSNSTDMEVVASYIDIYFNSLSSRWNKMMDEMSELATLYSDIKLNYDENLHLIGQQMGLDNKVLKNIDQHIASAASLNTSIENLTQEIRDEIIETINTYKAAVRKNLN